MLTGDEVRFQRYWARVAGLMYWVVLIVDMTGMRLRSSATSKSLMLAGSLFTVPLALGLYYALKPVQTGLARTALGFRLVEAGLGLSSVVAGFPGFQAQLAGSGMGSALLQLAAWDNATNFAAFVFTIGSTIFFYLFVRSGYIPRVLAWWGLLASVLALGACSTHLINPGFKSMTMYAWIPMLLAETSTGAWLLIKSVNPAGDMDGSRREFARSSHGGAI